jgi:transcriptional regulator GlxA family with amidase domain
MLSTGQLPIQRIAQRCGFGSEETMRRAFLRRIAVTPQDYRRRFCEAGAPGTPIDRAGVRPRVGQTLPV